MQSLESRHLMAGDVDPSFGFGFGITSTNFGGIEWFSDIAFQNDGKIVALGTTSEGGGLANFALARYHSNGALDNSFGGVGTEEGMTITDFGQLKNEGKFLAVLPDGKILAAGLTEASDGETNQYSISVARYDQDGILDPSYGTNGKLEIALSDSDSLREMVVSDNEILFVARRELIRVDMDGSMDTSFGGDGRIHRDDYGLPSGTTFAATDHHDGKYVVGTFSTDSLERILRLNFDGSADNSFQGNGVGELILEPANHQYMTDIAILGDGSIAGILSGQAGARIFRLDDNGFAMDSFHVNGIFENEEGVDLEELLIQPNGSIVAVGSYSHSPSNAAAIRLTADGMLDTTFGNQGMSVFNLGISTKAQAVLGYANGKILLGGTVSGTYDFFLARLTGNDAEVQFDGSGELVVPSIPPSQKWDGLVANPFEILRGLSDDANSKQDFDLHRESSESLEAKVVETLAPQQPTARPSEVRSRRPTDPDQVDQIDKLFGELGIDFVPEIP